MHITVYLGKQLALFVAYGERLWGIELPLGTKSFSSLLLDWSALPRLVRVEYLTFPEDLLFIVLHNQYVLN